jgi:hypothetical protein
MYALRYAMFYTLCYVLGYALGCVLFTMLCSVLVLCYYSMLFSVLLSISNGTIWFLTPCTHHHHHHHHQHATLYAMLLCYALMLCSTLLSTLCVLHYLFSLLSLTNQTDPSGGLIDHSQHRPFSALLLLYCTYIHTSTVCMYVHYNNYVALYIHTDQYCVYVCTVQQLRRCG